MAVHSEDDILALLGEYFPAKHESLLLGRGDDCAIVRGGGPWAVTCDVFVEDAHFRRRYFSAYDVGWKSLAVNLSDVASSGAKPTGCVVGLTLTGEEDEAWLRGFAAGMAELADRYEVALAGGDLARAANLNICVTAWGELATGVADLRRGRAKAGDVVFVAGELGLARAGLLLLEATQNPDDVARVVKDWPAAAQGHLRPLPLVETGQTLARLAAATGRPERFSLMDVSDGLARDLPRLLASSRTGLGAEVEIMADALPAEVLRYAEEHGLDPALFAFQGGEDYALLGSCPAECWPDVASLPGVWRIGMVRPGNVHLNGRSCSDGGFDHFA